MVRMYPAGQYISKSLIHIKNNIGPNYDPHGTSHN